MLEVELSLVSNDVIVWIDILMKENEKLIFLLGVEKVKVNKV